MENIKIEVNCLTGEVIETQLTADEITIREADLAAYAKAKEIRENQEKLKATEKELLLARLGITADEAALLLS